MKLEKWALIAEIVGSVAVIATLVMLLVEVRENTEEARAANRYGLVNDLREQLLVRAQSPSLAAVLESAASGMELTPAQHSQYIGYLFATIKGVEEAYYQYVEGRIGRELLDTRVAGLVNRYFLGNEIGRAFFEDNKARGEITAEFAQMIDSKFAEINGD